MGRPDRPHGRPVKYLNHLTLNSGHIARTSSADVAADTRAVMAAWLEAAIKYVDPYLLPGPLGAQRYSASIAIERGSMLCTVFAPPLDPLVTFGVARRSRQAAELWPLLRAQFGGKPGIKMPGEPWCAVHIHPVFAEQFGASAWIGDFERCVAWAWIER